jgi:hypothetical protein
MWVVRTLAGTKDKTDIARSKIALTVLLLIKGAFLLLLTVPSN